MTVSQEEQEELIPQPARVSFTFTDLPVTVLNNCPVSVNVMLVELSDIRNSLFDLYRDPLAQLSDILEGRKPLNSVRSLPPMFPNNAAVRWPGSVVRIESADQSLEGIRYLANVAQDLGPDITYEGIVLSRDRQYALEVYAPLDCGMIATALEAFPDLSDEDEPSFAAWMEHLYETAPQHPKLGPAIQQLDQLVRSLVLDR